MTPSSWPRSSPTSTSTARTRTAPYDVVIEGYSEGRDPAADFELVESYREVGLTWWIERLDWFRGPLDEVRRRLEAGPPRA